MHSLSVEEQAPSAMEEVGSRSRDVRRLCVPENEYMMIGFKLVNNTETGLLVGTRKKEGGNFKYLSTLKHFLHSFDHIKGKLPKKGEWLCCFS